MFSFTRPHYGRHTFNYASSFLLIVLPLITQTHGRTPCSYFLMTLKKEYNGRNKKKKMFVLTIIARIDNSRKIDYFLLLLIWFIIRACVCCNKYAFSLGVISGSLQYILKSFCQHHIDWIKNTCIVSFPINSDLKIHYFFFFFFRSSLSNLQYIKRLKGKKKYR